MTYDSWKSHNPADAELGSVEPPIAHSDFIAPPIDPGMELARHVAKTCQSLQDLCRALRLANGSLRVPYPHEPRAVAETSNLWAAVITEIARIVDDNLIGPVIRLADDAVGALTTGEIKESYGIVSDVVHDNWTSSFTTLADANDEQGHATSKEDWTRNIIEALAAVRSRAAEVVA